MDALANLLDGPRARGAFLLRSILDPPWSIRIQDRAPLTLVSVVRGDAWIVPDAGDPVRLGPGDVSVIRGPDPYTVADDPATPPQALIHPDDRATTLDGKELCEAMDLGVRTWGHSLNGSTVVLSGTYHMSGEVTRRLLDALPTLVVLPAGSWDSPLVPLLANEVVKDEPGQDVVLDRLLDLLLVAALREWFAGPEAEAPRWYRARDDPAIGPALRLLVDNPAHGWTVATLAAVARMSRAAFAKRFTELVGEPPMTFLAGWRLAMAADLLRDTDATLDAVAQTVGYGSPFALSTAFKRVHGVSPQEHRRAAQAAAT
jgi:AraC-like DNA-binding protein